MALSGDIPSQSISSRHGYGIIQFETCSRTMQLSGIKSPGPSPTVSRIRLSRHLACTAILMLLFRTLLSLLYRSNLCVLTPCWYASTISTGGILQHLNKEDPVHLSSVLAEPTSSSGDDFTAIVHKHPDCRGLVYCVGQQCQWEALAPSRCLICCYAGVELQPCTEPTLRMF